MITKEKILSNSLIEEIDNSIKFTFSSNISPQEVRIWSANSESKNFSEKWGSGLAFFLLVL